MKKRLFILLWLPLLAFTQELKDFTKDPGYAKYSPSVDSISFSLYGYEHYMPTSTCGEIIHYSNYSVSFCEEYRLSEWAIYYKDAYSSKGGYSRKGLDFKRDPNLNGRDGGNVWYYKNI